MWEKLKNDLVKEQKRRLKDKEQQEQGQAAWKAAKARFKRKPYYCAVYVTGSGEKRQLNRNFVDTRRKYDKSNTIWSEKTS